MTARPAVAVVITCFNLGRFVERAIDSVRAQTWSPIEMIVIDDGSDDVLSRQTLRQLSMSGVRVVRTRNRGASAARNTAGRMTRAPYLVMLDADDRLHPDYLSKAVAALEADATLHFVSSGVQYAGLSTEYWVPPQPTLVSVITEAPLHVATVVRRSLWDAIGGFDEAFSALEDLDFWTRALQAGARGMVLPAPYLEYHLREGSNSHRGWSAEQHDAHMSLFYEKHRALIQSLGTGLIVSLERSVESRRAELVQSQDRLASLGRRLDEVRGELATAVDQGRARGKRRINLGDLHRGAPFSPKWGMERGQPLDRYYIETFLGRHRQDIRGRVLEIKDSGYTRLLGDDRVTQSDVLDIDVSNSAATLHADLTAAPEIASDLYDCFICTQTLGLIFDVRAALREAARVLKPGGVLLCTLPAAGRLSPEGAGLDGDYWRFGEAAVRRLFAEVFEPEDFSVSGFGNAQAVAAFLYGMNPDDLDRPDLDQCDPHFPVVYGARAVKRASGARRKGASKESEVTGLALMYHRITSSASGDNRTDPATFEQHLDLLRDAGCVVVPLAELQTSGSTGSHGRVALTFDDGYMDALEVIAPILIARGLPATFFAVADDGGQEFWWDVLQRVFVDREVIPARFDVRSVPAALGLPTGTPVERREVYARVKARMYVLGQRDRDAVLDDVLAWAQDARTACRSTLTPAMLRDLARQRGMTVGSHTVNHLFLPLQPEAIQRHELTTAKMRLEAMIGLPVEQLAYPYGGYNDLTRTLAAEAGYRWAVTTDERPLRSSEPALAMPRIDVRGCSVDDLAAKLGAAGF